MRGQVVRMRTQLIKLLRAQLRQEGYRLPSGSAETVARRYATLQVPAWLAAGVAPIIALLDALVPVLAAADAAVAATVARIRWCSG